MIFEKKKDAQFQKKKKNYRVLYYRSTKVPDVSTSLFELNCLPRVNRCVESDISVDSKKLRRN